MLPSSSVPFVDIIYIVITLLLLFGAPIKRYLLLFSWATHEYTLLQLLRNDKENELPDTVSVFNEDEALLIASVNKEKE